MEGVREVFHRFAAAISNAVGTPWAFMAALAIIIVWVLSGPIFHFSDTWQLIINTGTTIVTFLIVFLIQNSQNRSTTAIQLKLDELLRASKPARTGLIKIEKLADQQIADLQKQFDKLANKEPPDRSRRKKKWAPVCCGARPLYVVICQQIAREGVCP